MKILKEISTHLAILEDGVINIYEKGLDKEAEDDMEFMNKYPHLYRDELVRTIPKENEEDLLPIFEDLEETNRILAAEAAMEFGF